MSSTETQMSITTVLTVAPALPPWVSMLLRARHGLGKSSVVRQVSHTIREQLRVGIAAGASMTLRRGETFDLKKLKECVKKDDFYPVIDRRCSQMTEGDMVGLPNISDDSTRFNPPDWFKRGCDEPVVLFLDEINRATPEIMQAAFQIILDRELQGWKLHPLTRVYSAINTGGVYNVNVMDPALLDRFFAVDIYCTPEEWCAWAESKDPVYGGDIHESIVSFIKASKRVDGLTWLYGSENSVGDATETSPRAWEALNRSLSYAGIINEPAHPLFYPICAGHVGTEATIAYQNHAKTMDSRISPEDVINGLEKRKDLQIKIKELGQSRQRELIERVAVYCLELGTMTDKTGPNLKKFLSLIPDELKITMWSTLTSKGIDNIEFIKTVHKHTASEIMSVFGVPMGAAGIGVQPTIPGMFSKST